MSVKNARDFNFSKRAASYDDGVEGKVSRRFYNLLLREVMVKPGSMVLDVGCGTGVVLKRLADKIISVENGLSGAENRGRFTASSAVDQPVLKQNGSKTGIIGFGTDIEKNMIAEAKKNCPNMTFTLASCDALPFNPQSFDIITACMAYHHFKNKDGFAKEACRLLKPGGVLYIADPLLPWAVRKTLNGVLKLFNITGQFFTPSEMEEKFKDYGFFCIGTAIDRYAQVIKLQKYE